MFPKSYLTITSYISSKRFQTFSLSGRPNNDTLLCLIHFQVVLAIVIETKYLNMDKKRPDNEYCHKKQFGQITRPLTRYRSAR